VVPNVLQRCDGILHHLQVDRLVDEQVAAAPK